MKILAFGASSASTSINHKLAGHAAQVLADSLPDGANIDMLDLNDYELPLYSTDREKAGGIPAKAQEFYDRIGAADVVIVSFAEHNGSYTAAYKNILDWASRIKMAIYQNKPVVYLSASLGKRGGISALTDAVDWASYLGADVRGHLAVGPWGEAWDDETGALKDPALAEALRAALAGVTEAPAQAA